MNASVIETSKTVYTSYLLAVFAQPLYSILDLVCFLWFLSGVTVFMLRNVYRSSSSRKTEMKEVVSAH